MLSVLLLALSLNPAGTALAELENIMATVATVTAVDLDRYAGTWYEIARYPNRFQESCAGDVTATYERKRDGSIRVINRCVRTDGTVNVAEGAAKPVEGSRNARLKVRFAPAWLSVLPFVWADYWVLGLADDYRWALVGTPDKKYLWVLSRTPQMDEGDWNAAVAAAVSNGFDPGRLLRTSQTGR